MIVQLLKWALSKFEPKPTLKEQLAAWPFPAPEEAPKTKPKVAKATTRPAKKTVVKKTAVKSSPLLKVMKQEQKEVKKILKQKAK